MPGALDEYQVEHDHQGQSEDESERQGPEAEWSRERDIGSATPTATTPMALTSRGRLGRLR
ncbi:hypothetical protein ACFZCP_29685 [Streptomyces sp. NPDC007971]|uniref:hypothetical protein n=1 Tax=Streptomyces sp. NPDC007971 TaxID=3364799 RepID=UPI0036EBB1E9